MNVQCGNSGVQYQVQSSHCDAHLVYCEEGHKTGAFWCGKRPHFFMFAWAYGYRLKVNFLCGCISFVVLQLCFILLWETNFAVEFLHWFWRNLYLTSVTLISHCAPERVVRILKITVCMLRNNWCNILTTVFYIDDAGCLTMQSWKRVVAGYEPRPSCNSFAAFNNGSWSSRDKALINPGLEQQGSIL